MSNSEKTYFIHSIKLPHLYKEASKILQAFQDKKGSLKSLVFSSRSPRFYSRLLALLNRVVDHGQELDSVLEDSRVLAENPRLSPAVARVLVAELLWGNGRLPAADTEDDNRVARPIATLRAYSSQIRALAKRTAASGYTGDNQPDNKQSKTQCPRYVRVNTVKKSLDTLLHELSEDGWKQLAYDRTDLSSFISVVKNLEEDQFVLDIHVPNLLVFAASTNFTESSAYNRGEIVLQDKASCLPAFLLSPPEGARVIDACAAPGMKTSHLSAIMNNTGNIVAVEMNAARLKTLNIILSELGVSNVRTMCSDFMKLLPSDYPDCTHILLDPSCSGSGMWRRPPGEAPPDSTRLRSLANMQAMLLNHALSFPAVKRVVYSTCSEFALENEQVVAEALKRNPQWTLARVAPDTWREFGQAQHISSWKRCLRTDKQKDLCCGFFVAVFRRRKAKEGRESMSDTVHCDVTDCTNQSEVSNDVRSEEKHRKRKPMSDAVDCDVIDSVNQSQGGNHGRSTKKRRKSESAKDSVDCDVTGGVDQSQNGNVVSVKIRRKRRNNNNNGEVMCA